MAKKNGFGELLDTALGNDSRLAGMLDEVNRERRSGEERMLDENKIAQRRAVDKVRNAQRGRGKRKEGRKMIAFQVPEDIADKIEELCYALGKTKNDLYNEAVASLVKKYSKYLNI